MDEVLTCLCSNQSWIVKDDSFICSRCGIVYKTKDLFPTELWDDKNRKYSDLDIFAANKKIKSLNS